LKRIFILVIVFLFGCNIQFSDSEGKFIETKVIKVVDGDTIKVRIDKKIVNVRILNIDTPEVYGPKGKQPFGKEASLFANNTLEGKLVKLELSKKKKPYDNYGRLLAYVFVNGELYETLIVREGLARIAYVFEPDTKYLSELRESEKLAKKDKKNIWSIDGYVDDSGYNTNVYKKAQ
jgi:micrococcal nuclease